MKSFKYLTVIVVTLFHFQTSAFADTAAIEARLSQLEQEIAILKRQLEVQKEEADKKAPETPIITASAKDGFSIKSPDESFKLKVRGLVQADARVYTDNKESLATNSTDNLLMRRARPIFEGTVGKNFDFYLMPDLANNSNANALLVDAYVDFKLNPALKIRGGKFKAPLGLERLQSDAVANFIESGLPSNLVPNRDVGFEVFGDVLGDSVNYAVGIFNGGADLASVDAADNNNDKDVIGRIFVQPFKNYGPESLKGLGLGIAGSYGRREGTTYPTYRSPGQIGVFTYAGSGGAINNDGPNTRFSPQAYFYKGSLGLLGEYVSSSQEFAKVGSPNQTLTNTAWQISGNYVLTGEIASYKGLTPRTNFDLSKGTWGAFELVGRYGQLDVDDDIFENAGFANLNTAITKETAWATGVNWYPHKNVRVSVDYEQTNFDRGNTNGNDRPTENAVFTRLQLAY